MDYDVIILLAKAEALEQEAKELQLKAMMYREEAISKGNNLPKEEQNN